MFVVAQFKGKEGILLQSTKAIVRRDLTGRSTMRWGTYLKRYGTLYLLLLVPLAFFIIFRYVPMSYILLAFKKNNILKAPWLLDWAKNGGWEWFIKAFNDKNFIDALKNTIIYLAALTGISPELYEAAEVDGASRLRKIWHITLPGIRSTIIILLIMNLGRILGSEFDRPFTLSNPLVEGASKTISIFVYERGIKGNQFALSTAVGLFQSVVCVIFLLASNTLAKKFDEPGIM